MVQFPLAVDIVLILCGLGTLILVFGYGLQRRRPALVWLGALIAGYPLASLAAAGLFAAAAPSNPFNTLAIMVLMLWYAPALLLMQLGPLARRDAVGPGILRIGRLLVLGTFGLSTVVLMLQGPPPEAALAWFVLADSAVSRVGALLSPLAYLLWVGSFAVAPVCTWVASRPLRGRARRDAVLCWIASLLPVATITLCTVVGFAAQAGGLGEQASVTALLSGFGLGGFLQTLVLAGLETAGRNPVSAAVLRRVLGGSVLFCSALLALAAGLLTSAGNAPSFVPASAAALVAIALAPLALVALRWVDGVLDPNRVLAAELAAGSGEAGRRGAAIEAALRAALNDPELELMVRAGPGEPWQDTEGGPRREPGGSLLRQVSRDGGWSAVIACGSRRSHAVLASITELEALIEPAALEAVADREREHSLAEGRRADAAATRERGRLLRDMHDGVQGRLLGLTLNLQLGSRALDDPMARLLISDTVAGMRSAIEELRSLARGRGIELLARDGLRAALIDFVAPLPGVITLDATIGRVDAAAENIGYFVAAEALTNALKHSGAEAISVRLRVTGNRLQVLVIDDGIGKADPRAGTGLRGVAERVRTHGGLFLVSDNRPRGTRIEALIPCASS